MTEKQYNDLMFGISTIITLLKKPPQPMPGLKYTEVIQMANDQLENNAREVFQKLTGNPLTVMDTNNLTGEKHEINI
jgi:hypothetical protein